ncbi:MAG: hypothetical protein KY393_09400 [Actinobacteria bacterium]|nr:hypothetical protein [Actinomycetota bacterium]
MATGEEAATEPQRSNNKLRTALIAIAGLHAALLLLQGVFAGNFMAGDNAAMQIHQVLGTQVLYPVAIGQAILGGVLWRRKELSVTYPLLSVVVVLAEGAQIGFGFTEQVAIHVPLGVALFGATTVLLMMSYRRPEPPEDATVEPST